jgi:hypothetical protein
MQNFSFDASRDQRTKREVVLSNGNKYYIQCTDPYGFWKISMDKGQVADVLSGDYTSPEKAEVAIKQYVEKTFAVKKVVEVNK